MKSKCGSKNAKILTFLLQLAKKMLVKVDFFWQNVQKSVKNDKKSRNFRATYCF